MRFATKVVCLCVLWYVSGSGNSIAAKKALSLFPYPMTVSNFENYYYIIYKLCIVQKSLFIVFVDINTSIAFLSLLNCVYFLFFLVSPLRLLKVSMLHLLAMNCLLGPALTLLDIPPTPHLNKRF